MLDSYRYQFKHFDPLDGALADPYAVMFIEETIRARRVLNGFSSEQITNIAIAINKLIKDKNFIDPTYEDLRSPTTKIPMFGQILEVYPSTNNIEAIYRNINNVNLSEYMQTPNITWAHVFATLCLFYCELISSYLFARENWKPGNIFPQITTDQIINRAKEFMPEARQAITYAEIQLNQPKILKEYKTKIARTAAKKRYSTDLDPLKDLVFKEYKSKFYKKSNREASKLILESLSAQGLIQIDTRTNHITFNDKVVLRSDDPEKRIEIWLGKHNRGIQ